MWKPLYSFCAVALVAVLALQSSAEDLVFCMCSCGEVSIEMADADGQCQSHAECAPEYDSVGPSHEGCCESCIDVPLPHATYSANRDAGGLKIKPSACSVSPVQLGPGLELAPQAPTWRLTSPPPHAKASTVIRI
jgi:hypothetical protein